MRYQLPFKLRILLHMMILLLIVSICKSHPYSRFTQQCVMDTLAIQTMNAEGVGMQKPYLKCISGV